MLQYEPLKVNADFRRAYTRGKLYTNPALVTYVIKNRAGVCRIGITTSKKIGIAVKRNRARRIIRAALSEMPPIKPGYNIVFVARTKTTFLKSTDLVPVMLSQLTGAGVLKDEKSGA